jgi:flotillin
MKETTGLDLANIINADSYDAKVNRNINLSGLDNLNVTVDAKQNSNQNVNINERE